MRWLFLIAPAVWLIPLTTAAGGSFGTAPRHVDHSVYGDRSDRQRMAALDIKVIAELELAARPALNGNGARR